MKCQPRSGQGVAIVVVVDGHALAVGVVHEAAHPPHLPGELVGNVDVDAEVLRIANQLGDLVGIGEVGAERAGLAGIRRPAQLHRVVPAKTWSVTFVELHGLVARAAGRELARVAFEVGDDHRRHADVQLQLRALARRAGGDRAALALHVRDGDACRFCASRRSPRRCRRCTG